MTRIYPPTELIEETDFRNAYAKAVRTCMNNGFEIVANSKSENPVKTKDMNSIIVLTGNAIKQIINKEIHLQFPTKGMHLDEYLKQFTYEYLMKHLQLSEDDKRKFKYLYIERLANYKGNCPGSVDQIGRLFDKIREDGTNRQTQIITWQPCVDFPVKIPKGHDPPCLQRIWIRVLEEPEFVKGIATGNIHGLKKIGKVEIHMMWRSRDLYAAWMSNIVGIIHMLIEYALGDDYEIIKIVDFCNSLHIYEGDWETAKTIKLVPVNPQYQK